MKRLGLWLLIISTALLAGCRQVDEPAADIGARNLRDILRIYSYAPDTMNPIFTQNRANREMLNLIFEPLMWVSSNLEPVPVLATSWAMEDGGLAWTVQLRENVVMHDGEALTAADVLHSFALARNSEIYGAKIANVREIQAYGNSIRFYLNVSQPNFINMLEIPIVREGMGANLPIGTGPFAFVRGQVVNKTIDLEAFNEWWNEERPAIRRVEVRLMPDDQTSFFAFDAGEIDVVTSGVADLARATMRRSGTIAMVPTNTYSFMALNTNRAIFADVRFRRAVAYAINKEQMASDVFGGRVAVTNTFANPNWGIHIGESDGYEFSVSAAREILEEWEGGRSFEILVNSENEGRVAVATFIANNLREVGIDARVRLMGWAAFESAVSNRQYDAFIGAVAMPNDANPTFLLAANSARNFANFTSYAMQEELENWQRQTTLLGQQGGFYFVQRQYLEDLPFISLYFEYRAMVYSHRVWSARGEFEPMPHNMFFDVNHWRISM